ncbi:TDT family transporter [Cohaesibacter intestini]|uniref:TDT family transporter n=1 Tax=Cohaesibacter intestini TaxID=2211145 RepID=UPI000DE9CFE0|nr:TDT family transporter [Cohaesibacter intestini]
MTNIRFYDIPTPLAGLALGIASLGNCWEMTGLFSGGARSLSAGLAFALLLLIAVKFLLHPAALKQDLEHPVVGSVVPTFAMALMIVSMGLEPGLRLTMWLVAVGLHLGFLVMFLQARLPGFTLGQMVPSWFVPPVGLIVANVSAPPAAITGSVLGLFLDGLFWFALACYAVMLPVMLYRLIFLEDIPDAAKPTIAILAAPASLSLTGYLSMTPNPSMLLVMLLLGIALLMTTLIYVAFFRLMRLPFSPAYAAFTFPMVIGATALFKVAPLLATWGMDTASLSILLGLAQLELAIATLVVGYVAVHYGLFFVNSGAATHTGPVRSSQD